MKPSRLGAWLFSPAIDLAAFTGSAVLSLALLAVGWVTGTLDGASPDWTWVFAVLLVDVAHVHLTFVRVYMDPRELLRRPARYALVPLLSFATGVALYQRGPWVFWRALAYLAVFHFVRQQVGWMRLYHARASLPVWRRRLDLAATYLATLYPLAWWHAHLPRRFDWFVADDFAPWSVTVVGPLAKALGVAWALALAACAIDSLRGWITTRSGQLGRDLLLLTTAACWFVGIVVFDSDYAFTVTNVFIHGVPYFALVYLAGRVRDGDRPWSVFRYGPAALLAVVWAIAFAEELVWDRAVWGDRPWLFGEPVAWERFHAWLVPLLATPQVTHYVLDGIIWRRSEAPELRHLGARQPVGP